MSYTLRIMPMEIDEIELKEIKKTWLPCDRMIEILGPIFGIGFLIWLTLAILVLCAVRYFENL
jgi:hypothetical protein